MVRPVLSWNDELHGLTNRFIGGVAERLFGPATPEANDTSCVGYHHCALVQDFPSTMLLLEPAWSHGRPCRRWMIPQR
jgi:hypothetical protein